MNVEIYIHGTPEGYDVYTTSIEKNQYVQTFFGAEYNDQSLIVETKIEDSNIYCYYTYFRKNIQSYVGRSGGYVGITLRTDYFVRNVQVMYQVMDVIYNQFITGNIVSDCENKKIVVKSLTETGKRIVDQITSLLSQIIQTRDVIKMDDSFLGNAGAALYYNPCDNRCKDMLSEYKKAEKLVVSPSSSLLRENQKAKEYQQKLEFIKKETEERYVSQLHKMQSENKKLQKERDGILDDLHTHVERQKKLENHVWVLEANLSESERKIKSLSDQANLKTELVNISEPLMRLNTLLQRVGIGVSSLQKNQPSMRRFEAEFEKRGPEKVSSYKSSNIWKIALILFALASILLLTVLVFQIRLYSKYNYNHIEAPKVEIGTDIDPTNKNASNVEEIPPMIEDYEGARIDIRGYSGKGGLQYGKEYILFVSARNSKPIKDVDGINWNCDGGVIDSFNRASARLRIERKSGIVRIVCNLPNGRSIEREMRIQPDEKYDSQQNYPIQSPVRNSKKEVPVSRPQLSEKSKYKE